MHPFRLLAVLALIVLAPAAEASLAAVRRAQELVGDSWSQVIRIENQARPTPQHPRVVHALVFETAGILWFYTPTEGTQSLSLRRNRTEEDKADLSPLLREINPGFRTWTAVGPEVPAPALPAGYDLPNACLLDSLAAARAQWRNGTPASRTELLMVYFERRGQLHGHTVLAYETPAGVFVIDSDLGGQPKAVSPSWPVNARELAAAAFRPEAEKIRQARTLALIAPAQALSGLNVAAVTK